MLFRRVDDVVCVRSSQTVAAHAIFRSEFEFEFGLPSLLFAPRHLRRILLHVFIAFLGFLMELHDFYVPNTQVDCAYIRTIADCA